MSTKGTIANPGQISDSSVVMGKPITAWNKALTGNFVTHLLADHAKAADKEKGKPAPVATKSSPEYSR